MRYFLTGATGFIGGELARQLRAAGHDVVALVRSPSKAEALRAQGVQAVRGDITDRASLREPMAGADGVFHVAAWYKVGVKEPQADRINVEGTRHVLETMRELGIPRGVYTSTVAVFSDTHGRLVDETYRYDGPHVSEYDRTKWRAHYEVALPMMAAGLPLAIVMPGVVYGPGDTSGFRTAIRDYLEGKLPATPAVAAYCWAHVEDVARAHVLAMEKGRVGESYIIAGDACTLQGAFELAEGITGIRAPRLHPRPALLKAASALMGIVERVVPVPSGFTAEGLRVLAGVTYMGSNAKARRELGYAPRPFSEGWRQTLAHEMRGLGMAVGFDA